MSEQSPGIVRGFVFLRLDRLFFACSLHLMPGPYLSRLSCHSYSAEGLH
jgi:hypothetical protein